MKRYIVLLIATVLYTTFIIGQETDDKESINQSPKHLRNIAVGESFYLFKLAPKIAIGTGHNLYTPTPHVIGTETRKMFFYDQHSSPIDTVSFSMTPSDYKLSGNWMDQKHYYWAFTPKISLLLDIDFKKAQTDYTRGITFGISYEQLKFEHRFRVDIPNLDHSITEKYNLSYFSFPVYYKYGNIDNDNFNFVGLKFNYYTKLSVTQRTTWDTELVEKIDQITRDAYSNRFELVFGKNMKLYDFISLNVGLNLLPKTFFETDFRTTSGNFMKTTYTQSGEQPLIGQKNNFVSIQYQLVFTIPGKNKYLPISKRVKDNNSSSDSEDSPKTKKRKRIVKVKEGETDGKTDDDR